jgi:hypothetical protein
MPIAGEPSRHLWFLDTEVTIIVSHMDGSSISTLRIVGRPSVLGRRSQGQHWCGIEAAYGA